MNYLYPKCPNCDYQRDESDKLMNADMCPMCGIVYQKWKPQADVSEPNQEEYEELLEEPAFIERVKETFLAVPEQVDTLVFSGRIFAYLVIIIWGAYFIFGGINWVNIGSSFLHNVNLPFHEFGHLLFSPLGRFWTILGGTIFQIIVPLIVMCAFSFKNRDNFAAAIMLWWCGQNFIDVSPYIADAKARALPLILGLGEESHDWGNLLTMTNNLHNTELFAQISFTTGAIVMLLSFIWAGYLLVQQKKVLV